MVTAVRLTCKLNGYQLDAVKAAVVVVLTLVNIWVPVLHELFLHCGDIDSFKNTDALLLSTR
jgi:hypothetical protein